MTNHIMLPEKENFLRLKNCDFNTILDENNNFSYDFSSQLGNSKLPCTLKKISNPILILFYYDNTRKGILTEFFESSFAENLEEGKEEDKLFLQENDTRFNFGFVNLDLEDKILKAFQEMNGLNPFSWAKIEGIEETTGNSTQITYEKYPFIIFYYNSLPQFMYEGIVSSETIKSEFLNWRKEIIEMDNREIREIKEKKIKRDGYFKALEDNKPFQGIQKGKIYWLSVTENTEGIYDYEIKPV